ncbi:hypothetical protein B0I29_12386 [Actinoplanes lutulentus]|uniref:Glutathione synthase/RimK-type ligase-like ATP-grasp enzyme n=1 Tax=Actinoplanes lutulentus TaxID=1287878 RepID=A0A327Z023_9ACTN|nr:hypothetical protein B0I29_12386 [Actinoplanes lutulentus]
MIGRLDGEERAKLALFACALRQAGHAPVIVDAELFRAGLCFYADGSVRCSPGAVVQTVARLEGHHRLLDGTPAVAVATAVPLITAGGGGAAGAVRVDAVLIDAVLIDAVLIDAIDIDRRLEFEGLYRQVGTIPWESVLNVTFKNRTRHLLDGHLPQPRWAVATPGDDPSLVRHGVSEGDVWVKSPNDTHGRGVHFVAHGEGIDKPVRSAMRDTPDGRLCLIEEDIHPLSRAGRADLSVTVVGGRAVHAVWRFHHERRAPTNSAHGGWSVAADVASLPAATRELAEQALTAAGLTYGSADLFGATIGELNLQPGGHSPGFLERVVTPLVAALRVR